MSLSEGLVTGWMPSYGDNDDVDISNITYPVQASHDFRFSPPALSRASSNDSYSNYSQFSDYPPSSPDSSVDHMDSPLTDLPSTSSLLSSSDRRAIRNRMRDPDWVPRPRNAFIIFRCEYSRKHARDPSDHSDRSSRCDKTLSKRAGEEWRRLSAAEREQYKVLAEQEKVTHALQNPDYRFKPMRRPSPATSSNPTRARSGTGRRNDRSARVASLIMRSERSAPSPTRESGHEGDANSGSAGVQTASPPASSLHGRRRSASMPQPVATWKTDAPPAKPKTPAPLSCISSPGAASVDFDMFSGSEVEDSPLYTPVLPTSPGLLCGMQMLSLPEGQSSLDECALAVNGNQVSFPASVFDLFLMLLGQNSPAPLGASPGDYVYTDSGSSVQQPFSFADLDLYPSLDMTTPYADWACGAPTESYSPSVVGAISTPPKSNDFGASGCFGPQHLPIPSALHTTSALDETPATLWGASYPQAANGSTMFDSTLAAAFPEVLATGYDAGLDEFINVL
jgi:hypothetical protein